MRNWREWTLAISLVTLMAGAPACDSGDAQDIPVSEINERILKTSTQADLRVVQESDARLRALRERATSDAVRNDLRKIEMGLGVTVGDKERIRAFWAEYVSLLLKLDEIKHRWIPETARGRLPAYNAHVSMAYYIWIVQYYHSILLHETLKPGSNLIGVLNDAQPAKAVPELSFATIKHHLFGAGAQKTIMGFYAALKLGLIENDYERSVCHENARCRQGYETMTAYTSDLLARIDRATLWRFVRNFFKTKTDHLYFDVWFPIQKGVAERMGDTRIVDANRYLVTQDNIRELRRDLEPGDILVIRRNWFLSNVGLPGFWPHAALYVGTPEELGAFLNADPEVNEFYGQPFLNHLDEHFPGVVRKWFELSAHEPEGHHPYRVIEAQSEGVMFTSIEHSAHGDYVAAMRPMRSKYSKLDIARALEAAFASHGRPYDFDFNFLSDAKLVCTELVYNAWLSDARTAKRGPSFDLLEVMGRPTLPANEMVRQFAARYGSSRQELELVAFLDGSEESQLAWRASVSAFLKSHERPKFSHLQD